MIAAEAFERERPRLERIAYAIVGTLAEAEDVVQETWLRLQRALNAGEEIRDLPAWLVTVTSRLALDVLGSARRRREQYVGEWLPEPVVGPMSWSAPGADPADRVTLDESVSMALLVVLEQLSPAERTAFLLHDVFGMPFADIAAAVGRTPAAVRQLASRARRHVGTARPAVPRNSVDREEQAQAVLAFARATSEGDLDALMGVLDPDVVWRSDGGGKVIAARKPVVGALRVARAFLAMARKAPAASAALVDVNGAPGIVMEDATGVRSVVSFAVSGGRIAAIDIVRNPDKLARVPPPASLS